MNLAQRAFLTWDECPLDTLHGVQGLFTDIDDTLTRDGVIEPAALIALHKLRASGLPVVAITGRPMGWSLPFAREWPLNALVAENGSVALLPDPAHSGGVRVLYAQDEATREANTNKLKSVARQILDEVPGATLARDSAGRVTDIAVDHSEFDQLDTEAIDQVMALMRGAGMSATVSSIHINGWYGDHDKLSGASWMLRELWDQSLLEATPHWLFVGDSTNDQRMFGHFPLSVGVANLLDFANRLSVWPRWVTQGPRGEGFAQVAERVLTARTDRG